MSHLAKSYDPKEIEDHLYEFWEKGDYFRADPTSLKPAFSIVIPPPNVTGALHMGHALVDTLQDILIRWKRMKGFEVLWVPGTDHAGIATQTVVEKELYQKTKKRRKDFSREEFLSHVWSWKEHYEKRILSQIKKLGCSCDWSRIRFTMDPQNNKAVRTTFKKMFDQGLIYRGDYLVNWDPIAQTALSDDEVEYEEKESFLWHIRYDLVDGSDFLVVATTRPETLFGDVAVAVHPQDERYASFIGKKVKLPLTEREIDVIADPFIDPQFGTGAVKITPAHDFNDFEMGMRHGLERINILTPDAFLNEKTGRFAGLSVEKAREEVLFALKQEKRLVKQEPHRLRVGISYRSKGVIQPYLSKQWFIKMSFFKEKLISAVKEKRVELVPPHWEATYFHWIENLRDWCISRQLWWGHQIPIWHQEDQMICYGEEGVPPEVEKNPSLWRQDQDVLDTWFSAALWPLSTLGWPDSTLDLKRFYPTSVLITGHDILFFWVARMIMMGEYLSDLPPFHQTFLHGLIYAKSYWRKDASGQILYITGEEKKAYDLGEKLPSDVESKWEKMSKTKGNVIDPLEIIQDYGTDALRLGLSSSATQARQIDLDRRKFEEYKNFVNKIWNGARFVLLHVEKLEPSSFAKGLQTSLFSLEDHWIFSRLQETIDNVERAFSSYHFDKAATFVYEFFWNDFCSLYLEASKPKLFGKQGTSESTEEKRKILVILLFASIRLMHPIIPFITEKLFSLLKEQFQEIHLEEGIDPYTKEAILSLQKSACIIANYPDFSFTQRNIEKENQFQQLQELIRSVRNIRMEMALAPQEKCDLYLIGKKESYLLDLAQKEKELLLALLPLNKIDFVDQKPNFFGASAILEEIELFLPLPEHLKEKEKERIKKELEKVEKQIESTALRLENQEFLSKAPAPVVQKLQTGALQLQKEKEELLKNLKKMN